MEAATDVVNCISNGSELLDASMAEDTGFTQKLRLYQSIADHYSARDEALWPDAQSDLHYELYSQLMQGRRSVCEDNQSFAHAAHTLLMSEKACSNFIFQTDLFRTNTCASLFEPRLEAFLGSQRILAILCCVIREKRCCQD